jgi:hypothetical protein
MDVEIASHFSMRSFAIGMAALVVLIAMLFTLPEYVGLELTFAMMATLGVLVGMYVILITEVIHRTALALFGALVMLVVLFYTGVLDPHDSVDFVIGAIDFNTIGLLLGMMVIVGILGETGIFQYIGIKAAKIPTITIIPKSSPIVLKSIAPITKSTLSCGSSTPVENRIISITSAPKSARAVRCTTSVIKMTYMPIKTPKVAIIVMVSSSTTYSGSVNNIASSTTRAAIPIPKLLIEK